MLKRTIKRMVLTGATVMVLMSTAAPAMAAPAGDQEDQQQGFWWIPLICIYYPDVCAPKDPPNLPQLY
jgi:hypothetical protein